MVTCDCSALCQFIVIAITDKSLETNLHFCRFCAHPSTCLSSPPPPMLKTHPAMSSDFQHRIRWGGGNSHASLKGKQRAIVQTSVVKHRLFANCKSVPRTFVHVCRFHRFPLFHVKWKSVWVKNTNPSVLGISVLLWQVPPSLLRHRFHFHHLDT